MILVLNENRDAVAMISRELECLGLPCETTCSEADFLDRLNCGSAKMIVVDISSDSQDGLFLIERIRKRKDYASIPIVAVSSVKHPLPFVDAYERGADEYLTLPLAPGEFAGKAKRLLQRGTP